MVRRRRSASRPKGGLTLLLKSPSTIPAGYAHPAYLQSLAEFGTPITLPASGGCLLRRPISDGLSDAMGPYPLFCCADWEALSADWSVISDELVSVVLVADPFGPRDESSLRQCFDRVVPFKTHFLADLDPPGQFATRHHRYYAERALREVAIDVCDPPAIMLPDWIALYRHLIARHAIAGIQAFSPQSFYHQFAVPGLVALRATTPSGEPVGAHLWFVQGDIAYSHLAAASPRGYEMSCSYALYDFAIRFFRGKVRWLDLGGVPTGESAGGGLAAFKRGWSNASHTAYLCGKVLNQHLYDELAARRGAVNSDYFPIYRATDPG
jgi:hypothetical protein